MCIKEDPGLLEPAEELEMVWNTDGCNFDNPLGLWRVVGCNTFQLKKEALRCKSEDYETEPSTAYRRIKLSLLPARPSLTKKNGMSKGRADLQLRLRTARLHLPGTGASVCRS